VQTAQEAESWLERPVLGSIPASTQRAKPVKHLRRAERSGS